MSVFGSGYIAYGYPHSTVMQHGKPHHNDRDPQVEILAFECDDFLFDEIETRKKAIRL